MPTIIETTDNISKTIDMLMDFLAQDEFLSKQFENYIIKNQIEITKDSELNEILINYILDGRIENGKRVLDYFQENNPHADFKTVSALKNSFVSVFQIQKMTKNSFTTIDLVSKKEFTLIPLVKTTSLRGVGLYDFLSSRVFELDNNFYILEIFDCFGQLREYWAYIEAVKAIIKNPKIACINNKENFLKLRELTQSFNSSFIEAFNTDEVIVSNKHIDSLLGDFYSYHTGKINELKPIPPIDFEPVYFDIPDKNDILLNAISGFDEADKLYDIGIFSDSELGIFLVPHLGLVNKIFSSGIKDETDAKCIKNFVGSNKVSINLLKKKADEYKNFVEIINQATEQNFTSLDEIIDFYKSDFKDGFRFSTMSVLYNSESFSKVLGKNKTQEQKTVGRNDPCPCGSGKKYKKCCLNKNGEK